ncbi:1870_t:CDS:1, partial [Gigaspora rosea]
ALPKAKVTKSRITEPSFGRRDGRYLTRTNRTVYFGTKVTPEFDKTIRRLAHETAKSLGVDPTKCQRLLFYEITPRSIKEALNNLVNSQLSRQ